jgi:glutamate racemase
VSLSRESQTGPINTLPIGVFDSGLGGLRVLDRLLQAFPNERFIYLGDTQHMPYGHKTDAQVRNYVSACLSWLFARQPVKLMVIACNTAAAVATPCFEPYAPVPFVDPVTAICGWLAESDLYKRLGLMATPATVASTSYRRVLDLLGASHIDIQSVACEHLASVIEAGEVDTLACRALLEKYLSPLREAAVEAIVLGCTHYPYAHAQIAELAPESAILDPDIFMVRQVERLLPVVGSSAKKSFTENTPASERVEYYVTQSPERFFQAGRQMPFQAIALQTPQLAHPDFASFSTPEPAHYRIKG